MSPRKSGRNRSLLLFKCTAHLMTMCEYTIHSIQGLSSLKVGKLRGVLKGLEKVGL